MSRNKEIKAMVVTMCDELRSKTIKNCKGCCAKVYCRLEKYANLLYDAGYRKQVTPNPKTNFDLESEVPKDE